MQWQLHHRRLHFEIYLAKSSRQTAHLGWLGVLDEVLGDGRYNALSSASEEESYMINTEYINMLS
jgi:hypothetical protein